MSIHLCLVIDFSIDFSTEKMLSIVYGIEFTVLTIFLIISTSNNFALLNLCGDCYAYSL